MTFTPPSMDTLFPRLFSRKITIFVIFVGTKQSIVSPNCPNLLIIANCRVIVIVIVIFKTLPLSLSSELCQNGLCKHLKRFYSNIKIRVWLIIVILIICSFLYCCHRNFVKMIDVVDFVITNNTLFNHHASCNPHLAFLCLTVEFIWRTFSLYTSCSSLLHL